MQAVHATQIAEHCANTAKLMELNSTVLKERDGTLEHAMLSPLGGGGGGDALLTSFVCLEWDPPCAS